jgi:multimeric flavodoxin WrbA
MKVKVVGIYENPKKGGNSDILLDRVLRGAYEKGIEVKRIYVRDLRF